MLENAYYVPHHAIFKQSSTTQLRPVYNASEKSSNGFSLNEQVAIGKMDQPDMLTVILRWRKFKIGISADLEKMNKQAKILPEQYHLQLILWCAEPNEKIKTYAMTTVFKKFTSIYRTLKFTILFTSQSQNKTKRQ